MNESTVSEASWRLACADIANGGGVAKITLRSGVQFIGRIDRKLSEHEVLFLRTTRYVQKEKDWPYSVTQRLEGWVCIDWTEIAAIAGEPSSQ